MQYEVGAYKPLSCMPARQRAVVSLSSAEAIRFSLEHYVSDTQPDPKTSRSVTVSLETGVLWCHRSRTLRSTLKATSGLCAHAPSEKR